MIRTANVPKTIATAVAMRFATFHELATVYGVEDLYDMIEVAAVESYNRYAAAKKAAS